MTLFSEKFRIVPGAAVFLVVGLFAFAGSARAQFADTLQQGRGGYTGTADAHIFINKPGWNTGGEDLLEASGNGGEADAKHTLIRFDLGALPQDLMPDSAFVELYFAARRTPQSGPKKLFVYRLLKPWGEGTGNDPGGNDGRPAQDGECSWQYAIQPDLPWSKAGANAAGSDYVPQPSDSLLFTAATETGKFYRWKVTPFVRYWMAHPDSNFGLLLREQPVSPATGILDFSSSEAADSSLRPRLVLFFPPTDQTAPGQPQIFTQLAALRIQLPFWGDRNRNAAATVRWRRSGTAAWNDSLAMGRESGRFTASLNGLTGFLYDVQIRLRDPDGVRGNALYSLDSLAVPQNRLRPVSLQAENGPGGTVQLALAFLGDANQNASAALYIWLPGDTLAVQNMVREDGQFSANWTPTVQGVTVTFLAVVQDPDGVAGNGSLQTALNIPGPAREVQLLFATDSSFALRTGSVRLFYAKDSTGGYLWLFPADTSSGGLGTKLLHGKNFDLLDSGRVRSITPFDRGGELGVTVVSQTSAGRFDSKITVYRNHPGLVHLQVWCRASQPFSVQDNPKDFFFIDFARKSLVSGSLRLYAEQLPYATGVAYFSETAVTGATIFYLQNFTALNEYFEAMHAEPKQAVFAWPSAFGYTRPFTATGQVPAGHPVALEDALLFLWPGVPENEEEKALQFLNALAASFDVLGWPQPPEIDWPAIARRTLSDLQDPVCWVTVSGKDYLRAYVDINRPNTAEMIAQLDVLVSLRRFEQHTGQSFALDSLLSANLINFYHFTYHTVVNNVPPQGVTKGDSWYAVQLHLGLSALAKLGDASARTLLLLSVPALMELAHNVNYRFPVFFDYASNQALEGKEPDVAGGYAYLMLDLYDLTGDARYLQEAEQSIARIRGQGFGLTYEVHMTAAAAAACARLYRLTGDAKYLRWSYMPVASVLHLSWLWECDYGFADQYRTFAGLSPMPGAGYSAAKELHETWFYLREYLSLVGGDVPGSVRELVQAFLEHAPAAVYSALPPFMNPEALFTGRTVFDAYNHADLAVPVEDLRTGFQRSGQIGQEIYGAGAAFTFALAAESTATAVRDRPGETPGEGLWVFPNPARVGGKGRGISFLVRWRGRGGVRRASLRVFNTLGQQVWRKRIRLGAGGTRLVRWMPAEGEHFPAGIYFARIRLGRKMLVQKFLLLQ